MKIVTMDHGVSARKLVAGSTHPPPLQASHRNLEASLAWRDHIVMEYTSTVLRNDTKDHNGFKDLSSGNEFCTWNGIRLGIQSSSSFCT